MHERMKCLWKFTLLFFKGVGILISSYLFGVGNINNIFLWDFHFYSIKNFLPVFAHAFICSLIHALKHMGTPRQGCTKLVCLKDATLSCIPHYNYRTLPDILGFWSSRNWKVHIAKEKFCIKNNSQRKSGGIGVVEVEVTVYLSLTYSRAGSCWNEKAKLRGRDRQERTDRKALSINWSCRISFSLVKWCLFPSFPFFCEELRAHLLG